MSSKFSEDHNSVTEEEIIWAYRILLGREPELDALKEHAGRTDFCQFRSSIFKSEEFRQVISAGAQASSRFACGGESGLRASWTFHSPMSQRELEVAYNLLLKRDIESPKVLQKYLDNRITLFRMVEDILESDEMTEHFRRKNAKNDICQQKVIYRQPTADAVLLVSASGNGNLGDAEQPDSMMRLLKQFVPSVASSKFESVSWEQRVFPKSTTVPVRPPPTLLDMSELTKFKLVVFGGGGLFGVPHFPLHNSEWVSKFISLDVPYVILGVGASEAELNDPTRGPQYRLLLQHSALVTGRDRDSLRALKAIAPAADLLRDPILLDAEYLKPSPSDKLLDKVTVYIPKFPADQHEEITLNFLSSDQKKRLQRGEKCVTLLFEPHLDGEIATRFENRLVVTSVREAAAAICGARRVYSMRYHGVIVGLLNSVPTYGMGANKIRSLLEEAGLPEFYLDFKSFQASSSQEEPYPAAIFHQFVERARLEAGRILLALDFLAARVDVG